MPLPPTGLTRDALFERLTALTRDDLATRGGRTWAYVYDVGHAGVDEVAAEAYMSLLHENALDPTVFPSVLHLENEVVGIVADHVRGGPDVVGSFTSGGTESCMLAVKAARDYARAVRGIARPHMVLPVTAHAAFHKAAAYFEVPTTVVDVDSKTFRAIPDAIARAIDDDTALVVASAPSYAHGVIDPVEEIAAIARARGVLLHVDACVGGWLLPWLQQLGDDVPAFDFTVAGVTSISVDLHKYAYCPKGASVVLYRDRELRRHQLFACAGWTGYTVINPTMLSTKSGGPLAAAWATLHHVGEDGYVRIARDTREATRRLIAGIERIDGLRVLGEPRASMVAAAADGFNIFDVIDAMRRRGWYVQPQLAMGPSPANVHFSVTATSLGVVDAMLADLEEAVGEARGRTPDSMAPALGAQLAALEPDAFTPALYQELLQQAGIGGGSLPSEMAGINTILDALPPALREQLLLEFVNELYVPTRGTASLS